jgi:Protein of unknown function (DUF4012)
MTEDLSRTRTSRRRGAHSARRPVSLAAPAADAPPAHSGLVGVLVLVVGLAGALLWLNMLAGPWRLATGLIESADHLKRAEKGISSGRKKVARYETLAGVAAARRAADGFERTNPLLDLARVNSSADALLTETPHLVAAANHSADAAEGTLDIAENALVGPDKVIVRDPDDPEGGARIRLDRISEIGDQMETIRTDLAAATDELRAIELDRLPRRIRPRVSDGITRARDAAGLLKKAQRGMALLPTILGGDGPRTYLLAMQNSAELRGTGGAMLKFADLRFEDGKAELLKAQSVYNIDQDRRILDIDLPDDAWYQRAISDARRFGNANWSPDWPRTSQLTLAYREAADAAVSDLELEPIDGVIGVDPVVMRALLKGAGRFETHGGRPFTFRKAVPFLLFKMYAQIPDFGERRRYLNEVVDDFYARVLKPVRPTEMLQSIGDTLGSKHMQIWMADPAEQRFVEEMGWDAALRPAEQNDYLYVVQQNVGGNKLNYFETQEHTVDVMIDGDDAVHSTEVRIANPPILPLPRYVSGDSLGLHRPMVNVYVPATAELANAAVEGERLDLAAEGATAWPASNVPAEHLELGKKVWSATLQIPPMSEGAFDLDYRVPDVVRDSGNRRTYKLVVQRQPKVNPELFTLRLTLPPGARGIKAKGFEREGNTLVWSKELIEDKVLEVSWRE